MERVIKRIISIFDRFISPSSDVFMEKPRLYNLNPPQLITIFNLGGKSGI